MDIKVILSVKHLGETKLIAVTADSSYADFVERIAQTWDDLKSEEFKCCCDCGSSSNICLNSEDDLQNLLLLCSLSDVRICSVAVCKNKHQSPLGSKNCSVSTESSFSSREVQVDLTKTPILHSQDIQTGQTSKKTKAKTNLTNYYPSMKRRSNSGQFQEWEGEDSVPYYDTNLTNYYTSMKRRINSGQFQEWEGEDSIPYYDICPQVKKTCLLSDSWADIFKEGVGTIFKGGASEFRTELIKYAAQMGFKFRYKKNTARYIGVVCDEDVNSNCDWFIRTRRQPITMFFKITKANLVHKCIGKLRGTESSRICPRIMGKLVLNNVRNDPNTSGKDIVHEMKIGYGIDVPYWKAHRAAEAARDQIYGRYADSYDHLRWYCEAIIRTNPGSIVSLEYNHTSYDFERLFIGFKACIEGFKSCRPMLFIDGTFMRGRARGTMIAATAKDGDNGLFPVAFAVVSAENEDNWEWFLRLMKQHVHHDKQIFYISDRNKGLLSAFPRVFEEPVHFFCLYHLIQNLKGRFGGGWGKKHRKKIVKYFKEAAYAPNVRIFDAKFKIFKEIGGSKVDEFLEGLPKENWAVAHSPHITRYGEMTSNAAESFNAWIVEERSLPITHMIESIRAKIAKWYVERRQQSEKWTSLLVPTKNSLWHYYAENGRTWYVSACPAGDYQVASTPSVRVDLVTHTCTCHQWQVTGFPYVHAVAAICRGGGDVTSYIDESFLNSEYQKCYQANINPIPETEKCEYRGEFGHNKILPPILNRPPGRPKKTRIPSYGETPKEYKRTLELQEVLAATFWISMWGLHWNYGFYSVHIFNKR